MVQLAALWRMGICLVSVTMLGAASAQPPATPAAASAVSDLPSLFFREEWRQPSRPAGAPDDWRAEGGVTAAAVTQPNLELKLYDPDAASIPEYARQPPVGSAAVDWNGPSCIQLSGYNQGPERPARVPAGRPSDPPNLWTGVCHTGVVATLRDKNRFVDLTGLARIRWVTRTSGFHVVRPVVKLADGTWLVGDYAEGAQSSNSTLFLESEFAVANIRWLPLDITRVVTRGQAFVEPDLSKVDEIGFADLLPGSGHGWGGFVNVGRIEVYGTPVDR